MTWFQSDTIISNSLVPEYPLPPLVSLVTKESRTRLGSVLGALEAATEEVSQSRESGKDRRLSLYVSQWIPSLLRDDLEVKIVKPIISLYV